LINTVEFYELKSVGLGAKFLDCVVQGLATVGEAPERWPTISGKIRRYLLRPFPYGLLYKELSEQVVILAVMHLHWEPGYWKARL
jgi:hypothetical protein